MLCGTLHVITDTISNHKGMHVTVKYGSRIWYNTSSKILNNCFDIYVEIKPCTFRYNPEQIDRMLISIQGISQHSGHLQRVHQITLVQQHKNFWITEDFHAKMYASFGKKQLGAKKYLTICPFVETHHLYLPLVITSFGWHTCIW